MEPWVRGRTSTFESITKYERAMMCYGPNSVCLSEDNMSDYNYSEFSTGTYDFDTFQGPALGAKAQDFTLSRPNGEPIKLLDFNADFLVLETCSITCPLFQSRRTGMAQLVSAFPKADFRVLYVREAHPGCRLTAHTTLADKASHGEILHQDGEGRSILIDTIAGEAHDAYGSYPNAVFIINRNGCVIFRSDWNNPSATRRALTAIFEGRPAIRVKSYFKPASPIVAIRTLRRAGKGASADFLRGLPTLIWKNLIVRNLRVAFGRDSGVLPDADC